MLKSNKYIHIQIQKFSKLKREYTYRNFILKQFERRTMDNDVLIVSYDKGYGNEIPVLLVGRNIDKGMEIIKAFEREEANKVYKLLSK